MTVDDRLIAAGQAYLVGVLDRLPADQAAALRAELDRLDLGLLRRLVEDLVLSGTPPLPGRVSPAEPDDIVRQPRTPQEWARDEQARQVGERMLADGRVAAVLLAGGQGTRLGFDGPKGDFPFAPVTGRTLFWRHLSAIGALRHRYATALPLYILTSPTNDRVTRDILERNGYFGLDPSTVHCVVQGTLPAVDARTGRLLRETPTTLALSPDGHGGLLSALQSSGALAQMEQTGIDTLYTFQVDNPLARICRPQFLGHHELAQAEMSSVVVAKVAPQERMGVIARVGGRPGVVEYSDLPDELAEARDDQGGLRYWAGSIAVHCIGRDFADRLTRDGLVLPYHRALKRVPHIDSKGRAVDPVEPNAVKFETFLFDALPYAERSVAVEAAREEEFAPIKNAEGADSPETARRSINRLFASWFAQAGVPVPVDAAGEPVDLEVDPRVALDAHELGEVIADRGGLTIEGPTVLGPQGSPARA